MAMLAWACSPDNTARDLRQCVAESPEQSGALNRTSEEEHDAVGAEVTDCIKTKGYALEFILPDGVAFEAVRIFRLLRWSVSWYRCWYSWLLLKILF
jgi:hypothetical protein